MCSWLMVKTSWSPSTDDEGQCVLTGIEGPIEVHIAADAYGTASVYGLNATYFSVNLKPLVTDAPQVLTLTGEVSGFDSIPDTGANEVKVAIVQHGLAVEVDNRGDFPELSQPDKEGQDLPQNMTFAAARGVQLGHLSSRGRTKRARRYPQHPRQQLRNHQYWRPNERSMAIP